MTFTAPKWASTLSLLSALPAGVLPKASGAARSHLLLQWTKRTLSGNRCLPPTLPPAVPPGEGVPGFPLSPTGQAA